MGCRTVGRVSCWRPPPPAPHHPEITMRLAPRKLVALAVCGLLLTCTACSSNKTKIVGKWKLVSMTDKDGKEQKAPAEAGAAVLDFTADGNINVMVDTSGFSPEQKAKLEENKELAEKLKKGITIGKYSVS